MSEIVNLFLVGLGFCFGAIVGGKAVMKDWRDNADTYIGKDGKKVVDIQFYDQDIASRYMNYLKKDGRL